MSGGAPAKGLLVRFAALLGKVNYFSRSRAVGADETNVGCGFATTLLLLPLVGTYLAYVVTVLATTERWTKSESLVSTVSNAAIDFNGDGSDVGVPHATFVCVNGCAPKSQTAAGWALEQCYISYDLVAAGGTSTCGSRSASSCTAVAYGASTTAPVCWGKSAINLLHKKPYITTTSSSCGKTLDCYDLGTANAFQHCSMFYAKSGGGALGGASDGGNGGVPPPPPPDPNSCPQRDAASFCCASAANGGEDCVVKVAHLACGAGTLAGRGNEVQLCFGASHTMAPNVLKPGARCTGGVRCCQRSAARDQGTTGVGCTCPLSKDATSGAVTCPSNKPDLECCAAPGAPWSSPPSCSSPASCPGTDRRRRRLANCPAQCGTSCYVGTEPGVSCLHDCNVGFALLTDAFTMATDELLSDTRASGGSGGGGDAMLATTTDELEAFYGVNQLELVIERRILSSGRRSHAKLWSIQRTSYDTFGPDTTFSPDAGGGCSIASPNVNTITRALDSARVRDSVGCFGAGSALDEAQYGPPDALYAADWAWAALQPPASVVIIELRELTAWNFAVEVVGRLGGALQLFSIALGAAVALHRAAWGGVQRSTAKRRRDKTGGATTDDHNTFATGL